MRTKDWKFSGAGGAHVGLFGRPTIHMEDNKDPKGGGKDGGGDDDDDDDAELPKDRKGFAKMIGKIVKGTIDGLEKSSAKKRAKETADIVAQAMAAAGFKPKKEGEDEGEEDDDAGDDKGKKRAKDGKFKSPEADAAINAANKKASDALKLVEEEKGLRLKAEAKADRDEERALLTEKLSGFVRTEQLDDVVELLGKRIHRDPESRDVFWKGDKWSDKEDADNSDVTETLEDGLAKWMASPKGKAYANPRDITGGGNRRPAGGGKARGGQVDEASDAEIGALISARTSR